MTAFFNAVTKKLNAQKIKENVILAIAFDTWQGQEIAKEKKRIFVHKRRSSAVSSLVALRLRIAWLVRR